MQIDNSPDIYYQRLNQYQSAELLFEAIKLDIFSYLSTPVTATDVAAQAGYNEKNTELLLLALHSCGYIKKSNKKYCNTSAGKLYLTKTSPTYIGETILFRKEMTSLQGIKENVKNGISMASTPNYDFAMLAEVTVPEMYATGRVSAFLSETKLLFPQALSKLKMLDLGGGSGIFAIEFATHYPNSEAFIFEHPSVSHTTKKIVAKHTDQNNITVISGDFNRDNIGSGYDFIVASGILDFVSDHLDDFIAKISCALSNNGYLLIIARYSEHEGYTEENILGWLSGYMNGIKPAPTKKQMNLLVSHSNLTMIRTIQTGRFQGYLYKKENS